MPEPKSRSLHSSADISLGYALASNLSARHRDRSRGSLSCSLPRVACPDHRIEEARSHIFVRCSLGVRSLCPSLVHKLLVTPSLSTIIPTAFRLATFHEDALSTNPTFEAMFQVWLQVGMHASLITATVLILRPVIYNLNTNYGTLGPTISHGYSGASRGSYVMSNLSSAQRARHEDTMFVQGLTEPHGISDVTSASIGRVRSSAPKNNAETESVESANSQRMIIRKKTSWTIEMQ